MKETTYKNISSSNVKSMPSYNFLLKYAQKFGFDELFCLFTGVYPEMIEVKDSAERKLFKKYQNLNDMDKTITREIIERFSRKQGVVDEDSRKIKRSG